MLIHIPLSQPTFFSKLKSFGFLFLVVVQLETPEFEKISTQEERKAFVEKLDEACIVFFFLNYKLSSRKTSKSVSDT